MRKPLFSLFLFYSVSIVALAAVRGDKGKYLVGRGGDEGACFDVVSFSVWFEYENFGTTIGAMVWSPVFYQDAGKFYLL